MGIDNDIGTVTLYVNGEPVTELAEIKIPIEVEASDFPPILKDFSVTFVGRVPKKFWWKVRWLFFKARLKALAVGVLQKLWG